MENNYKEKLAVYTILDAINTNNVVKLRKLLKNANIDIDIPIDYDDAFIPILHLSIINGNIEVVQILIENGANINICDSYGDMPLHLAINYRLYDIVILLIHSGADINATYSNGASPLVMAIENNCTDIAIALIDSGTDIYQIIYKSIKAYNGQYINIPSNALICSIIVNNIDIVNKLIYCNAKVDYIISPNGNILRELYIAIYTKNKLAIIALLKYKKINKTFKKNTICTFCGDNYNQLNLCLKCKVAGYCSKECQKEDFPIHRLYCKNITLSVEDN